VFTASFRTVRCRRRRHRILVLELSEFKKTLIWKVFSMSSCCHVSSVTSRMAQGCPSTSLVPFGGEYGHSSISCALQYLNYNLHIGMRAPNYYLNSLFGWRLRQFGGRTYDQCANFVAQATLPLTYCQTIVRQAILCLVYCVIIRW